MQANKTTRHKVQDHIFTSLTSRKKHLASGTTLDRLSFVVYSGPKVIWSLLSVGAEKWIHQIFLWSSSQKKQRAEGWITRKSKFIPKKLLHPVVSFVSFFLTISGLKGSICQTQQDRNQPGMKPRHGPWRWKDEENGDGSPMLFAVAQLSRVANVANQWVMFPKFRYIDTI